MSAHEAYLEAVWKHVHDYERPAEEAVWSPRLERASRAEIEAIQSEKLTRAFAYLFEQSPFHRAKFLAAGLNRDSVKGLADLRKIPITHKLDWMPDIQQNPPWGTFSPLSSERWRTHGWTLFSTSGTTGQPRLFRHTVHDRKLWAWMCARALWSYGVRPGWLALNCFFYGPSVAAWGMHHGLEHLGCAIVPGGPMPTERRALFIKSLRPQVLLGTPSGLLTLGHRMEELGDTARDAGVRVLVCAGEPGAATMATRARLQALWGAEVHDDFGCTEAAMAPLGYTCSHAVEGDQAHVHLMEDALIAEVLDPDTFQPTPDGERGVLVVSNLYSESAPFLRFNMGDWIRVTHAPCGCGRTGARAIGGLLGRNDHCIKIKGLQFFPSTFEDALRRIPQVGNEYRIEVRESFREGKAVSAADLVGPFAERRFYRDEVLVVVEPAGEAVVDPAEIGRRLRGFLGISVKVLVMSRGALPRTEGKGLRFHDLRSSERRSNPHLKLAAER